MYVCPVFISKFCTFYQLQELGLYRLLQSLHSHLPCTTLSNSEDLCIIGKEEEEEKKRRCIRLRSRGWSIRRCTNVRVTLRDLG